MGHSLGERIVKLSFFPAFGVAILSFLMLVGAYA